MPLLQTIEAQMKDAMRAHDSARLGTLRLIKAALVNKAVEKGRELDDAEGQQVLRSLVKQRHDSIEAFEKGNRPDLVAKERAELAVLESYLPPPVDVAEVERAVAEAIAATGASSPKDLGKVMKAVMSGMSGRPVEGKVVNDVARRLLGG